MKCRSKMLQVLSGEACELQSQTASLGAIKLSGDFEKACAENAMNSPSIKWQYFSSTDGITTLFPARRIAHDQDYDFKKR